MMPSLVQQISAASDYAIRTARAREEEARIKTERRKAACRKQWASRRGGGGNPVDKVMIDRLPKSEQEAITQAEVRELMADQKVTASTISSVLYRLSKNGQINKVGEQGAYRYFTSPGETA